MNIQNDLKIDKAHLDVESLEAPLKVLKYLSIYFKKLKKLNEIQAIYDELYARRMEFYKREYELIPENISELKILLTGDKELIEIKKELDDTNLEIHQLKEIVQLFKDRQWSIKNAIDFLKFTRGDIN
jgi:sulfite reductase alpha subunit-like flavoprotein